METRRYTLLAVSEVFGVSLGKCMAAAMIAAALSPIASAEEIAFFETGTNTSIREVAFSPDGAMLLSVSGSDISIWDLKKKERSSSVGFTRRVGGMATFLPDGQDLLLATFKFRDPMAAWDVRRFSLATRD